MSHITGLRFIEKFYDRGDGFGQTIKVLQQEVTHTFTDGTSTSRWEDVPLISETNGGKGE